MSGMMFGADAEELEQIAKELDGFESELGQLLREGVGAVSLVGLSSTLNTIWRGPRANEFAGLWQSRHLMRVRDVQGMLRDAATDLRKNATEQRTTSSASGSGPGAGRELHDSMGPIRILPFLDARNFIDISRGAHLFAELGQMLRHPIAGARPFYYGVMGGARFGRFALPGLTDVGMALSRHSDEAFNYFRGAKGGFRSAASKMGLLEKGVGRNLAIVGAGISATSILHTGMTEGVGSSEFAATAVDEGISAVVGFAPGGALAYEGGKQIGNVIYEHTPVGDFMLRSHASSDHIAAAERHGVDADRALAQGDFDAVHAANERASEAVRKAQQEAEGWTGMWNATKSLWGR